MSNLVEGNLDLTFRFHVTVHDLPEEKEETIYRAISRRLLRAVVRQPEQLQRALVEVAAPNYLKNQARPFWASRI